MSERPTPEMDAFAIKFKTPCGEKYWVPVDIARKLELELAEAREEIVLLKKTPLRKRCQELESALRRLLTADIPRPLGGIIDGCKRQAAIEWNAFERGEARQHAKAILQQNKEEAK